MPLPGKFTDNAPVHTFKIDLVFVDLHPAFALRMGLRYARGLREQSARAIIRERNRAPFTSIADLAYRVPELRRDELVLLASIGALNAIGSASNNNKDVLDQLGSPASSQNYIAATRYGRWSGQPALPGHCSMSISESDAKSPLVQMSAEERLVADFHGTGLTVGPHPLAYRREDLRRARILSAKDLTELPDGKRVRTAGMVVARQRQEQPRDSYSSASRTRLASATPSSRPICWTRTASLFFRRNFCCWRVFYRIRKAWSR